MIFILQCVLRGESKILVIILKSIFDNVDKYDMITVERGDKTMTMYDGEVDTPDGETVRYAVSERGELAIYEDYDGQVVGLSEAFDAVWDV